MTEALSAFGAFLLAAGGLLGGSFLYAASYIASLLVHDGRFRRYLRRGGDFFRGGL